jgi:hypothetical protein
MLDLLFGDGNYSVRFLLAFVVVLALIGFTAWLVRRFGAERQGASTARGRQPRLAVIDAAAVDGRRRLVLIRRDNVEHLIMIGGPSDVVIEPSIVRAAAAPRDVGTPRVAAAHGDGGWAPPPEPAPAMPRIVRPPAQPPIAEEDGWDVEDEPPPPLPRQHRGPDSLVGLAEISRNAPQPEPPAPPPPLPRIRERPREAMREAEPPRPPVRPPQPSTPADLPFGSPADQNLAEMAQRLEAALRRPLARADSRTDGRQERQERQEPKLAAVPQPPEPPPERERPLPPADPRPAPGDGRREARAAAQGQGKSPYDSLEQEMASLLGRKQ